MGNKRCLHIHCVHNWPYTLSKLYRLFHRTFYYLQTLHPYRNLHWNHLLDQKKGALHRQCIKVNWSIKFKKNYKYFFRDFLENPVMIKSSTSKVKFFEIFNLMDEVMKAINRAFSIQIMIMTMELFIYGLILIFCSAVSKSSFDTVQFFSVSFFAHAILFQVSYISSSTVSEVTFP